MRVADRGPRSVAGNRRPIDVLRGLFWLCHPGPALFFVIAVTAFALLATWPDVPWNLLPLVLSTHLSMQLSVAVFNDYCDRERDALSKKNKPIARGVILPGEALLVTLLLILVMLLLLIHLNRLAILTTLLYFAFGQSYNLSLKSTPAGGIVFALAIPLIPVYAFAAVDHVTPFIVWQIPVAVLLGLALHLANALPDIEQDATNRMRNIVVMLGRKRTMIAITILIILAAILVEVLAVTGRVAARPSLLLPTLLAVIMTVIVLWLLFRSKEAHGSHQIYFYLVVLTCLMLSGGWIASILVQ
jgi:4-hydroxybenzoate polyprenyltransferase